METRLLFWPYLLGARAARVLHTNPITRPLPARVFLLSALPPLVCVLFSLPQPPVLALRGITHPFSPQQLLTLSTLGIIVALAACTCCVPRFKRALGGKSINKTAGEKVWGLVCESGDWANFMTLVLWLPLLLVGGWGVWYGIDATPLVRIGLCVLLCGMALPILLGGVLVVSLTLLRLFHERIVIVGGFVFDPTGPQAGIGPLLTFTLEISTLWFALSALTWFVGLLAMRHAVDLSAGPLSGRTIYLSVLFLLLLEAVVGLGMLATWLYGAWWAHSARKRETDKILESVTFANGASRSAEQLLQAWLRLELLRISKASAGMAVVRAAYAAASFGGTLGALLQWILKQPPVPGVR